MAWAARRASQLGRKPRPRPRGAGGVGGGRRRGAGARGDRDDGSGLARRGHAGWADGAAGPRWRLLVVTVMQAERAATGGSSSEAAAAPRRRCRRASSEPGDAGQARTAPYQATGHPTKDQRWPARPSGAPRLADRERVRTTAGPAATAAQAQRVEDHADRAEGHRGGREHGVEAEPVERVEHAHGDRDEHARCRRTPRTRFWRMTRIVARDSAMARDRRGAGRRP